MTQQGSHQQPQKQINNNTKGHQDKQEASATPNINNYIPLVQFLPNSMGLPKIHKVGTPLRPIVSSRGSITCGVAKELTHIFKPLVGQSPHHHFKTHNILSNNYKAKGWNQGRSLPPLMLRLSSLQFQWHHPYK